MASFINDAFVGLQKCFSDIVVNLKPGHPLPT